MPEAFRIVWGYTPSGVPHVALEERADHLARVWRALESHSTWAELTKTEDSDVVSWLESAMEDTLGLSDVEMLADQSLYSATLDRLKDYDQEVWPWLGFEDEFFGRFASELNGAVGAALEAAFDAAEVSRGTSMTTGELVMVQNIHSLVERLTEAGAACRQGDHLIQDAIGPYQ